MIHIIISQCFTDYACGSWLIYQGSQKHTGFQALRGYLDSARTVKWTSLTHINIIAVPTVGDVNGDGLNEVLVIGSDTLFVLRGSDGSLLRFNPRNIRYRWG